MKKKSSDASRLGGFALGHFGLSLVCYLAFAAVFEFSPYYPSILSSQAAVILISIGLMALYFPLGLFFGAVAPWARVSTPGELVRSTLTQCGIAWGWAALVLCSIPVFPLVMLLFWPTIVLAFPSSIFTLVWAGLLSSLGDAQFLWFFPTAFLAGLLPPLLFNLGNFLIGWAIEYPAEDIASTQAQKTDG